MKIIKNAFTRKLECCVHRNTLRPEITQMWENDEVSWLRMLPRNRNNFLAFSPKKTILETTVEFYILRMIENVADMWQLIINRKCGWKELAVKILSSKRTDFLLHAYISSFWGVNKTRKPNPIFKVELNKSHEIKVF